MAFNVDHDQKKFLVDVHFRKMSKAGAGAIKSIKMLQTQKKLEKQLSFNTVLLDSSGRRQTTSAEIWGLSQLTYHHGNLERTACTNRQENLGTPHTHLSDRD